MLWILTLLLQLPLAQAKSDCDVRLVCGHTQVMKILPEMIRQQFGVKAEFNSTRHHGRVKPGETRALGFLENDVEVMSHEPMDLDIYSIGGVTANNDRVSYVALLDAINCEIIKVFPLRRR